jgi:hypothetical protein
MRKIERDLKILLFLLIVTLALTLSVRAQDKKTPEVPDAVKVKILQAQLAQEKAARQFEQLNSQVATLREAYQKAQKDLQAAEDEAYAAAKVKRDEWTLDETSGDAKFVAAPAKPAPAPEKKP